MKTVNRIYLVLRPSEDLRSFATDWIINRWETTPALCTVGISKKQQEAQALLSVLRSFSCPKNMVKFLSKVLYFPYNLPAPALPGPRFAAPRPQAPASRRRGAPLRPQAPSGGAGFPGFYKIQELYVANDGHLGAYSNKTPELKKKGIEFIIYNWRFGYSNLGSLCFNRRRSN
jgi:hypothetical protein